MPPKPAPAHDRVGPFALVRPLVDQATPDADATLWLAERVSGDRSPREAVVRRASAPSDRAQAARIIAEYEALRAVDDPRLPRVLGHFAGQAALAMSWAPGPTLAEAAAAHRQGLLTLDAATVLDICEELAQALRHVHGRRLADGRPLVHGRLDARRVRVGSTGQVTLLGLGRTGGEPGLADQAPERLAGADASARSDQWALGAMLIELLTGTPLYQEAAGPSDAAVRREGRVGPWIQPIAAVNPALGRLLERLLAVDPAARFDDEGELIRSLQALRRSLRGVADRGRLVERMDELGLVPRGLPDSGVAALDAGPDIVAAPRRAPDLAGPVVFDPARTEPAPRGPSLALPPRLPPPAVDDLSALPSSPAPSVGEEDEVTQPLAPGDPSAEDEDLPSARKPLVAPATSRKLGLGERAAILAVALLVVAAIAALAARS